VGQRASSKERPWAKQDEAVGLNKHPKEDSQKSKDLPSLGLRN